MILTALCATAIGLTRFDTQPLDAVKALKGAWKGVSEGLSGKGVQTRKYELLFGGRYVRFETVATFPAKNGKPAEVHRDMGIFSADSGTKKLALREFHVEGFVNTYTQEESPKGTLVFVTREIENIPPGFKARVTLKLVAKDRLEEKFELAEPGKPFQVYGTSHLRRQ